MLQFRKVIFTFISEESTRNMLEKMRVYRLVLFMHIYRKQNLPMKFNIHILLNLKTIPPTSLKAKKIKISVFAADHKFQ